MFACDTEAIDKLYLELSQFTTAKTKNEIKYEQAFVRVHEIFVAWRDDEHNGLDRRTLSEVIDMLDKYMP